MSSKVLDKSTRDENEKENDSNIRVFHSLQKNKIFLQKKFNHSTDVTFYELESPVGIKALVVFIDGIVNKELLYRDVINPLIIKSNDIKPNNDFEAFKTIFPVTNMKEMNDFKQIITDILDGNTIIFVDEVKYAISISCREWEKRAITEPNSETIIRGPKEGFIESIHINRSLIRRKIKNPNLVFETMEIGKQTKTVINISYVEGIVSKDVLAEVRRRLSKIDTDSILDAGYIEEFIEDSHISPISTVGNTQKPDIVAAKILEGRVAILCDGSPHVLTVPHLFTEAMQTSEDYYIRPYAASSLRIIRYVALMISILFPAFYVALETFHQEMLPTLLLITMVGANKGTPFPAFLEALLMITAFEFLKESGTRLPKAVGSAISIVGALVLGDAAVKAGVVSADLVIVVAFTAVSSFIIPSLNEMISIYRLILLALAGLMGLYGITAGVFLMLFHASSIRSFGVPYMSPLAPANLEGLKDAAVRLPIWSMKRRPSFISKRNKTRRK